MARKYLFSLLFVSPFLFSMDIYQHQTISELNQKIRIKKNQLALLESNDLDGDLKFKNHIKGELKSLHTQRKDSIHKNLSNHVNSKL